MKTRAILQAFKHEILPADTQLVQPGDPVTIGGHRVAGRLRSSGGGVVYLAHDRDDGLVTIKTAHAGTTDPGQIRARLRAEAACARGLPPSCTTRLLQDRTDQTPPYLVSEYCAGPSLERVVDVKGPLPSAMVTALAADLARLLEGVHGAHVVHGNLTPANILFTKHGLRLIDFGVAQDISAADEPAEIGAVADNPGWLAPELLAGEPPGRACDIFGWGCVVTYAATGHSPHPRTDGAGPARRRPLDTCALEAPLRRLVDASVAEDPGCRPTAAVLAARLHALTDTEPEPPRPIAIEPPRPHVRRRPRHPGRSRAVAAALLTIAALFVAVPTATEHARKHAAAPPPTAVPNAPPKKSRPKPPSNKAAMSLYDEPPPAAGRPAPQRQQPRKPRRTLWMSCSAVRMTCTAPGARPTSPSSAPFGWWFGWTADR